MATLLNVVPHALVLLACAIGGILSYVPGNAHAREHVVQVVSNSFQPANLTIQAGDTVRWVFQNGLHTTTSGSGCSSDGHWDSGNAGAVSSFIHGATFRTAGSFPYFCKPHCTLGMTGRITVTAAAPSASPTPGPTGSPAPGASASPSATPGASASPTPSTAPAASCDPLSNPIPNAIGSSANSDASLVTIVAAGQGLVSPNWGIAAPGDKRHLFVTDTVGTLWAIDVKTGSKNLVLDVSNLLVSDLGLAIPAVPGYDERGLLGVAFHPRYQRNRLLYLYTSEPYDAGSLADFTLSGLSAGAAPNHRTVISEWRVDNPRAAQPTISGGRRVVLRIDQPQLNHNGGALNFGPDGFLYVALGDGGSANDQDAIGGHNAGIGNGQDRATALGKILRIDPTKRTSTNGQYGIPRSNPYFARGSRGGDTGCRADGLCDEIWAYGFRNPYRFSFDKTKGSLLAGDVGQNAIEEVDFVIKGRNYGWRYKEGSHFFNPNGSDGSGAAFVSTGNCAGAPDSGLTDPIAQYDHDEGIAIVGGFVYRGKAIKGLRGQYVFGDYARNFGSADTSGRLFRIAGGQLKRGALPLRTITELNLRGETSVGMSLYGMGQDAKGELYVMGNTSGVPAPRDGNGAYMATGVIKKLIAPGATQSPSPSPSASPSPSGSPEPSVSPSPSPSSSPEPSTSPSPTPAGIPVPSISPSPSPSASPGP